MSALNLLWMLPLCAVVSAVYSATRSDDWNVIIRQSLRRFVQFILAAVLLGVVLMLFSMFIQPL